jgi:peptidoglycan/xylan/chitin deacetylase (PgdA/CDA1 family)
MSPAPVIEENMPRRVRAPVRLLESCILGPNYYKKRVEAPRLAQKVPDELRSAFTISFDCDSAEDADAIPSLLDVLDSEGVVASFGCVGHIVEEYPQVHRQIAERKHEIMNHTYTHLETKRLMGSGRFRGLPFDQLLVELEKCSDVASQITGQRPIGFRIPHFAVEWRADIYAALRASGMRYSSSTIESLVDTKGVPFWIGEILEIPVAACPDHPFLALDTYHALHARFLGHKGSEGFLRSAESLMKAVADNHSYSSIYLDPRDAATDHLLGRLCDIGTRLNLKFVTYSQALEIYA